MKRLKAEKEGEDQSYAGERIRDLLRDLDITQTALAKQCGVSPQYLNNIIRGQQRVTQEFATSLVNVAGVNLNWLFAGKGPMFMEHDSRHTESEDENADLSELLRAASYNLKRASDIASKHKKDK